MALRTDVSNSKDVNSTFEKILENYYAPPSIIVNAAGILKDNFLLNLSEDDFDKVINVNLKVDSENNFVYLVFYFLLKNSFFFFLQSIRALS